MSIEDRVLKNEWTLVNNTGYGNTGYGVSSQGDTKLERFLPKNQHTQSKLLNFEIWFSGELSKIGHHFRK